MRILPPPFEIDPNDPFKNDVFDRKPLAESLTNLFSNAEDPLVLALDGAWGTGKSTFAKMLNAKLQSQGFLTNYIDAFALDYIEDPFIPISMKISEMAVRNHGALMKAEEFTKKALRVGGKILGGLSLAALNIATQGAIKGLLDGQALDGSDSIGEKLTGVVGDIFEEKMKSFSSNEKAIDEFKITLAELAEGHFDTTKKPMVIFVDELDRCKPTFAVHFVERIKHFFAVDHLVFVLVMNKEQLERSIQACYGNGVNGGAYLQKFISIWVTIGFQVTSDEDGRKHGKYVEKLFNHYQLHSFFENDTYSFCNLITESANYFNTSLRETEKVFANLTIALSVAGKGKYPWIYECIVLLAFYKVIFPEHYRALVLVSKPDSHPIWPTEYLSTRHTWVDKSSTSKEISYLRGILNNPKIKEVYNGFPSFAKHLRRFFEFASTK